MVRSQMLSALLKGLPAVVLTVVGSWGLAHGRTGSDSVVPSFANRPPMGSPLAERLAVREISVDQRREAQRLMHAFTLAQMTRHYWGGFATSLVDLGLAAPDEVETKLENIGAATTLSIHPRLGDELYVAGVARQGGRLATWACVDIGEWAVTANGSGCPEGWQALEHAED